MIQRTLRCLSCGGVYVDVQRDGTTYQHGCPELSDAEVKQALKLPALDEDLDEAQRKQLVEADRTRPNARDERPRRPAIQPDDKPAPVVLRSEGLGVVELSRRTLELELA